MGKRMCHVTSLHKMETYTNICVCCTLVRHTCLQLSLCVLQPADLLLCLFPQTPAQVLVKFCVHTPGLQRGQQDRPLLQHKPMAHADAILKKTCRFTHMHIKYTILQKTNETCWLPFTGRPKTQRHLLGWIFWKCMYLSSLFLRSTWHPDLPIVPSSAKRKCECMPFRPARLLRGFPNAW